MMDELKDLSIVRLSQEMTIPPFYCEDEDLFHFLIDDAKNYQNELMAVTYLFVDTKNERVAAYFSLLNDKVAYDPRSKGIWNRINRHIHNSKRRKSYPSIKIGRLAVAEEYKGLGIGTNILNEVKRTFALENRTGCRFLTVDAYASATDFYCKNGFEFFTTLDVLDSTRLMYFDLKPVRDSLN